MIGPSDNERNSNIILLTVKFPSPVSWIPSIRKELVRRLTSVLVNIQFVLINNNYWMKDYLIHFFRFLYSESFIQGLIFLRIISKLIISFWTWQNTCLIIKKRMGIILEKQVPF